MSPDRSLLESNFPFVGISRLVAADRRAPDPAYQAHRWFARRPPALIRATLLAATRDHESSIDSFWADYAQPDHHLAGAHVLDPFMGGGTTLLEASRLGASVHGQDVDPMSVELNRHLLTPPSREAVAEMGSQLIAHLERSMGWMWPSKETDGESWQALHYFSLAKVTCPGCDSMDLLYRAPVLARSIGCRGAVVRDSAVDAFCPNCLSLHSLPADSQGLMCCGRTWPLDQGTFRSGRYRCPACGLASSHERLQTGTAPRTVIAVEETPQGRGHRRIRPPYDSDAPTVTVPDDAVLGLEIEVGHDRRPVSYGIRTIRDLHTDRQLAYLLEAMSWIKREVHNPSLSRALRLAVSTSITSNNRLCGYATDYGRLAPLFSVRAFALPSLTVELNPLHTYGGRGTLRAALARVAASCSNEVRRNVLRGETVTAERMAPARSAGTVAPGDSVKEIHSTPAADLCLTDPPYFDFIPYDTLSQVFRAWLAGRDLAGEPVLPAGDDPVQHFAQLLGTALANASKACVPGALLAFTFKGGERGWSGVADGLRLAGLCVTALWPVLADPGMGHHSGAGNGEFDMLVVCRPAPVCEPVPTHFDASVWARAVSNWRPLSEMDRRHMVLAAKSLSPLRAVMTSASPSA